MAHIGYDWSNQAQVYYDFDYEHISRRSAERIYKKIIGNNTISQELYPSSLFHRSKDPTPSQTCDRCGLVEEMPTRLVGDETYTLCEDCFNDQTLTKN